MKRFELALTALLLPLDFISLIIATLLASRLRIFLDILPIGESRVNTIGLSFLWWFFPLLVFFFTFQQLYILFNTRNPIEQLFKIISASSAASMILFMVTLVGRTPFVALRYPNWFNWASNTSLLTVFYVWIITIIVMTILRWSYRGFINFLHTLDIATRKILIVGNSDIGMSLYETLQNDKSLGYKVIGTITTSADADPLPKSMGYLHDLSQIISSHQVDQIIEADPNLNNDEVLSIIDLTNENHSDFTFAPNFFEMLATNVTVDHIGGIPVLNLRRTPLDGWGKIFKRLVDFILSSLLIIILSPIFLLIMLAIKVQDGGGVFFAQERISMGKPFKMLKFRSMIVGAEKLEDKLRQEANERDDGPLFKMKNDPRVTKLGRFLRKSRLDELPQLFNVFTGQMSLVGPRPHLQKEVENYQKHQRKVLAIKPGVTGPAQIAGNSELSFDQEVSIDTDYIENWSLIRDLAIFIKTPFYILFKDKSDG